MNQAYVIATSTKIDIGSVDSSKLADKNFTAITKKKSKQSQEDFFGKDAEPQKKVHTHGDRTWLKPLRHCLPEGHTMQRLQGLHQLLQPAIAACMQCGWQHQGPAGQSLTP